MARESHQSHIPGCPSLTGPVRGSNFHRRLAPEAQAARLRMRRQGQI